MRRSLHLRYVVAGVILLAACSDEGGRVGPATPSTSASVSDGGEVDAALGPPACDPSGSVATIVAVDLAFDIDCITVAAGERFSIELINDETLASERHNLSITRKDNSSLFAGDLIPGGQRTVYRIQPLEPGDYYFVCDPHPSTMFGDLYVR